MKLLTIERLEPYENAKISYIWKESLKIIMLKIKNIAKLGG